MPLDQLLQSPPLPCVFGDSGPQPRRERPDAFSAARGASRLELESDVVADPGRGFAFICVRHQQASRTVADPVNVIAECPLCTAERESRDGFLRYLSLMARRVGR